MSTFLGKITEIPEISVDRFDGENINSTIYFLSHCHTDHMRGLEDWAFHQSLMNRPNVFLYASPISIKILKGIYPTIESKLKELPLDNSTLIKYPYRDDKNLTVTPLPAGHCPGSVMFLFETDKSVLYTGDYRVSANDLKKYKAFYSLGKPKKIHKLYLDTTFFKKSFRKWPLRQESLENICKIIKEWTEQSKKHIIKIVLSATYGSEYLFIEIAKTLRMPIHVSKETYRLYKCIPEMDEAVTTNPRKTQIHAGCGRNLKNICESDNNLVRAVIPSALWWEGNNFSKGTMAVTEKGQYRVCYSCHASFEEIKDFLIFLQPMEIEPCVVPSYDREKKIMLTLLEETIQIYKDQPKEEDVSVKLFDVSEDGSKSETSESAETALKTPEKVDDDILDDVLASPPNNFKRKRLWLSENQEENLTPKSSELVLNLDTGNGSERIPKM